MLQIEFQEFPKIPRLFRECIISEKIDGTNACVIITEDGQIGAASRSRLITPENDNFGFARWVEENKNELLKLGPGHHFGEWWGLGIQRGYDKKEKLFSLFNSERWAEERPSCCSVVPVLYRGLFDTMTVAQVLQELKENGSYAAPGFNKPEGVVIFHIAAKRLFKVLLENDQHPKGIKHD